MKEFTLDIIPEFTLGDQARLKSLTSDEECQNWVGDAENNERTALIFLNWANRFKKRALYISDLLEDEIEESEEDRNTLIKVRNNSFIQAEKQYNAYIKYSK